MENMQRECKWKICKWSAKGTCDGCNIIQVPVLARLLAACISIAWIWIHHDPFDTKCSQPHKDSSSKCRACVGHKGHCAIQCEACRCVGQQCAELLLRLRVHEAHRGLHSITRKLSNTHKHDNTEIVEAGYPQNPPRNAAIRGEWGKGEGKKIFYTGTLFYIFYKILSLLISH